MQTDRALLASEGFLLPRVLASPTHSYSSTLSVFGYIGLVQVTRSEARIRRRILADSRMFHSVLMSMVVMSMVAMLTMVIPESE